MSRQKSEKFTATVTPKKTRQQKPVIQAEGKLTQEQLEAIGFASARSAIAAGGGTFQ